MNCPILTEFFSTTKKVVTERPVLSKKPDDKFETTLFLPACASRQGEGGLRKKGLFKNNDADYPLVTVITIVFNGAEHLEETILSVLNQTYDNVEYILVDGGSLDGTLDIIRKYEHAIDYWVSEKDAGIYDAMNKGIGLATGEWINFMNAGDLFYENKTIDMVVHKSESDLGVALIYGDIERVSDRYMYLANVKKALSPVTIEDFVMKMPICHQSMFFRLWSFKLMGLYNIRYKICADHDWLIKLILNGYRLKYLSVCIASYNMDGVSSSSIFRRERERLDIALMHFNAGLKLKVYFRASISFVKSPITFCLSKLNLLGAHRRLKQMRASINSKRAPGS